MYLFNGDDARMVDHNSEFFPFFFQKVVDCRVCGDPNSILRFAFVEFTDEGIIKS